MDFHAMKRKRLQSLCKKHGIPANLKNKEMADRLSFILNKGKENDVSCHSSSDDAGTDQGNFQCVGGKDLLNEESGELNSNYGNNDQLIVSGSAAGSVDASEEKSTSSGKRSPSQNLEERAGFSPKHLKNSEIKGLEPETNLSPEITGDDDIEICDVEENMQGGIINKEQVNDSQESLPSASGVVVMEDLDLVNVAMEESGSHMEKAEAEKLVENIEVHDCVCGTENAKQGDTNGPQGSNIKEQVENSEFGNYLGDKIDAEEEICETGKGRAESDKQYDTNSLQGSEMNDKNLPRVSLEESGYPLVVGEAQKPDETICLHGDAYNFQDSGSEVVDTMRFVDDTSIAAKDSNEKTSVTEHFPDEVHSSSFKCSDQFLTINPLSEANSSDLDIHQMVVSDACEANISISPDSEKTIGFSADLLNDFETKGLEFETNLSPVTPKDGIESFDVEEVLQAAPSEVVMNNVDLVQVPSEVFGNQLVQGKFEKLADKTDPSEGACGTGKGAAEAEKHYDINSPQGSNINDLNHMESSCALVEGEVQKSDDPSEAEKHDDTNSPQGSNMDDANPEESGYPLAEAEVLKSDDTGCVHGSVHNSKNSESEIDLVCLLDSHINAKDSDGITNFTADHFPDQVHSYNFEYSDGMPDQFLATFPPSEAKSSHFNMHEMVASDTTEEKLESSLKGHVADHPKECIEFFSMHLEASEIKEFETETSFDPSALGDIVGTCSIDESMQIVKTGTVSGDEDICQERLGLSPKSTPVADSERRNNFFPRVLESSMMKKELDNEKNSTLRTARDTFGTCDMKENINTAKKEQFGSTISKKTFTKRQPLQDLQQN